MEQTVVHDHHQEAHDASIIIDERTARCKLCDLTIPKSAKSVKQHLKSITHKKAVREGEVNCTKSQSNKVSSEHRISSLCSLCEVMDVAEDDVFHIAFQPEIDFKEISAGTTACCIAPPYLHRPKKFEMASGSYRSPFITFQNASMEEYPKDLEHAIELYLPRGGAPVSRMPNIDVDHRHMQIESVSQAREVLGGALNAEVSYWCAFAVSCESGCGIISNPSWWPATHLVPGYTQVIVGHGPTDIGIHTDVYGPEKRPVDTYITICSGVKQVLMLPPGKNFFDEGNTEEGVGDGKKLAFPLHPDMEMLKRIYSLGGYFFKLKTRPGKEMVTLFVPKGWHHWLLGRSKWAVIFGSSRF